jgi:hypothetical protein
LKNSGCLILFFFTVIHSFGQSTTGSQLWGEYILKYPFANLYNLEYRGIYSTAFGQSEWRSLSSSASLERAVGSHIDVNLLGLIQYTEQTSTYNTLELRPTLGVRYHITPNKRILSRFYLRFENRNIKDEETNVWTTTNRLRLRPEFIIPINKKSYREDKMWYGIADAEWFVNLEEDQKELFANRFRLRFGIGYRLSYALRFEAIYAIQNSKQTIDEEFERADNIFRLRVKHYLRKHKPPPDNH